jgi:hypothetical protein
MVIHLENRRVLVLETVFQHQKDVLEELLAITRGVEVGGRGIRGDRHWGGLDDNLLSAHHLARRGRIAFGLDRRHVGKVVFVVCKGDENE